MNRHSIHTMADSALALICMAAVLHAAPSAKDSGTEGRKPIAKAGERAELLKANLDRFELHLWPSLSQVEKPYYSLTLTVAPVGGEDRSNPFVRCVQISKAQAIRIIEHLTSEGFLGNAVEYDASAPSKRAYQKGYHLHVSGHAGHQVLAEHWGWNRTLMTRLDALRKALDGEAGKSMDFLIGRLAGHRQEWEKKQEDARQTGTNKDTIAETIGKYLALGAAGEKLPDSFKVHIATDGVGRSVGFHEAWNFTPTTNARVVCRAEENWSHG